MNFAWMTRMRWERTQCFREAEQCFCHSRSSLSEVVGNVFEEEGGDGRQNSPPTAALAAGLEEGVGARRRRRHPAPPAGLAPDGSAAATSGAAGPAPSELAALEENCADQGLHLEPPAGVAAAA